MKIVHLFIILYERNPEEQDPHIAVLEDARNSDRISTQLLKALNGRWVLDYPKPDLCTIFLRDQSLKFAS